MTPKQLIDIEVKKEEVSFRDDGYRIYACKNKEDLGVVTEYKHTEYGHLFKDFLLTHANTKHERVLQEIVERMSELKKQVRCAKCDGAQIQQHMIGCRQFDTAVEIIKEYIE